MKKIIKIIIFITVIIVIILIFKNKQEPAAGQAKTQPPAQSVTESDPPQIVSTKPDPLDNNIIPPDSAIEITFNRPLQNIPEFKIRIEPEIDYKVELSPDRKTAKIIPAGPLDLGISFTLFINADTKFDGVGEWKRDKTFHFRTVKYTGV